MMRSLLWCTAVCLSLITLSSAAEAKGCIKGAIVGGAVGHYAGHHGKAGAAVGCLVGHHEATKRQRQQSAPNTQNR
jgi:uncharacterized protein YcfJ